MGAETPARRRRTAKQVAEALGCHPRTVRKLIAEPREEFEERAEKRRRKAAELRSQGCSYKQIAAELGCSVGSVSTMLHFARKYGEMPEIPPSDDIEASQQSQNQSPPPDQWQASA